MIEPSLSSCVLAYAVKVTSGVVKIGSPVPWGPQMLKGGRGSGSGSLFVSAICKMRENLNGFISTRMRGPAAGMRRPGRVKKVRSSSTSRLQAANRCASAIRVSHSQDWSYPTGMLRDEKMLTTAYLFLGSFARAGGVAFPEIILHNGLV